MAGSGDINGSGHPSWRPIRARGHHPTSWRLPIANKGKKSIIKYTL